MDAEWFGFCGCVAVRLCFGHLHITTDLLRVNFMFWNEVCLLASSTRNGSVVTSVSTGWRVA